MMAGFLPGYASYKVYTVYAVSKDLSLGEERAGQRQTLWAELRIEMVSPPGESSEGSVT